MAFNAGTQWELRDDGSDSNGGGFDPALGGTDYTLQAAAQINYTDLVIGDVPPPPAPVLTPSATGGSIPAGTYYYVIAYFALTGSVETLKSPETSVTTTGTTSKITLTAPPPPPNAPALPYYRVYAGSTSGGPYYLVDSFETFVTNYVRTTAIPTSGTTPPVTSGASLLLSSVANPFTSSMNGNTINITGGAGFTIRRYQVLSVLGGIASVDKVIGPIGNSNGVGKLGGALASLGMVSGIKGDNSIVYIKNRGNPYLATVNSNNVSNGLVSDTSFGTYNTPCWWVGYQTNRTLYNNDPRPVIKANFNGGTFFNIGGQYILVRNLSFNFGYPATSNLGIFSITGSVIRINDCDFTDCYQAIASQSNTLMTMNLNVNRGSYGVATQGGYHSNFVFKNLLSGQTMSGASQMITNGLIYNCSQYGLQYTGSGPQLLRNITVVGCPIGLDRNIGFGRTINILCYGNNRNYNLIVADGIGKLVACASGNSNLPDIVPINSIPINIPNDPFVNSINKDYRLNNDANGGKLLRGAGYSIFYLSSVTGAPYLTDIGGYQTAGGDVIYKPVPIEIRKKRLV